MNTDQTGEFFHALYRDFNNRNIEAVIAHMQQNVQWANGMEGGYVHGHDGVREYWTRQFTIVSTNVTPESFSFDGDTAKIKVHQVAHDLDGNLLADEYVYHIFQLEGGKVSAFHIGEKLNNTPV